MNNIKVDVIDASKKIVYKALKVHFARVATTYVYNMIKYYNVKDVANVYTQDVEDLQADVQELLLQGVEVKDVFKSVNNELTKRCRRCGTSCYIEDEYGTLERVSISKYLYNSLDVEKHSRNFSELEYIFKRCGLTETEKEVLTQKVNSNLSFEDLARLTNRKKSTISTLYKRAKEKIRSELLKEE